MQDLWIADNLNQVLRKIDSNGIITTPSLNSTDPTYLANGGFDSIWGIGADGSGNVYVADIFAVRGGLVYRVNTATLEVQAVAGNVGGSGALGFSFDQIYTCCCDLSGNLIIADITNCTIYAVNTQATTQTIFNVTIAPGNIAAIVAGNAMTCGNAGDGGQANNANIRTPYGICVDASGNLLIADQGLNEGSTGSVVRKVAPNGIISTVAGTGGTGGFSGDGGPARSAQLFGPLGIAADAAGNFYIMDTFNFCVRAVNTQATTQTLFGVSIPAGCIDTVAGIPGSSGYSGDGGPATSALIGSGDWGIGIDGNGNLLISDTASFRIRKVTPAGTISTAVGTGVSGYTGDGGPATSAKIGEVFYFTFPVSSPTPPSVTFSATNDVLTWTTQGATSASIEQSPSSLIRADGQVWSAQGPAVAGAQVFILANDSSIIPAVGSAATPQAWSLLGIASSAGSPAPGNVPLNGSAVVTPTLSTTYTLTAEGPGGTTQEQVTVTVNPVQQPLVADGQGRYFFYTAPTQYTLVIVNNGIVSQVFKDQEAGLITLPFHRVDGWVKSNLGPAISGAQIFLLNNSFPNVSPTLSKGTQLTPPNPQIPIYADPLGNQPIPQPLLSDTFGNYFFYVPAGVYTLAVYLNGVLQQVYPDQNISATPALVRYEVFAKDALGQAIVNGRVIVCQQPAQVPQALVPQFPSPVAQIYQDANGLVPQAQTLTYDSNGNPVITSLITDSDGFCAIYAAPGTYTVAVYSSAGRLLSVLPDQTLF